MAQFKGLRHCPIHSCWYLRPGITSAKTESKLDHLKLIRRFGGPGRDRTDDLFHAIEARSLHSTTYNRVPELPSTSKHLQRRES